jgi:ribosomal protein L29
MTTRNLAKRLNQAAVEQLKAQLQVAQQQANRARTKQLRRELAGWLRDAQQ